MKKRSLSLLIAMCALCSMVAQSNFSGRWTGSLKKADSTLYPLTYNFSLIGDSVAGTAKCELGEFPVEHGRVDSAGLHFTVTVSGLDIYHDGVVYNDSIGMNITLNGSAVHCKLNRATE